MRDVPLLAGLTRTQLHALQGQTFVSVVEEGERVHTAGEPADHVYLLGSGAIKITRTSETGKPLILCLMRPGALFGGLASDNGEPYGTTAAAMQRSLCYAMEASYFERFLQRHPMLAIEVARIVARRHERATALGLQVASRSVGARLAATLVDLARDFGHEGGRGIEIGIRLTRTDLAQLVGSTRETTTTLFNEFRRRRWVAAERRRIWVLDMGALSRRAAA